MAEVQLSAQGSVIKTAYEAEADTNAYTDAAVTKLAGIVPGVATTNVFKIPGSLARGDIFFIDVSGNLVRLPAGTNGHFLKTQSTTGDPVWEALPGGGDMLKATYDPDADGIFAIAQGGTGQATAQAAIDAISQVAGATNEHVLTKDTGTGNATWKVGGGGGVTDHGALTGLADDDHTQYLHMNGTRAMTGDLDLGNNNIGNIGTLSSWGDVDGVILYGGNTAVAGSIALYGKNHASVPGMVSLEVPDAAKAGQKWALRVYGVSDTPKVDIAFGIDMNSKEITDVADIIPDAASTREFGSAALPWGDIHVDGVIYMQQTNGSDIDGCHDIISPTGITMGLQSNGATLDLQCGTGGYVRLSGSPKYMAPLWDNDHDLGLSGNRWKNIYGVTGIFNTLSFEKLSLGSPTELTVSGGVITSTRSYHKIDTEADAATDDLDTINGGAVGDTLIISPISDDRTIVVKNSAFNGIYLNGSDFTMDSESDMLTLLCTSTNIWTETSRSNNGA